MNDQNSDQQQFKNLQNTKNYQKIGDMDQFLQSMEKIQDRYNNDQHNSISNKKSLNLIMFQDACIDIIKISRAVSIQFGHSLTLGTGGKGRQSLNRLACFVSELKMFEIGLNQEYTIKQWYEDLKKVMMSAGVDKQKIGLLLSCNKIISEDFLEHLNQIISGGEINDLYGEKDQEEIYQQCKIESIKLGISPTKLNLNKIFSDRINQNFHLMLSLSPTKINFARRIRDYPFLIQNCQIIYLHEWSDQSMQNIAEIIINEYSQELGIQDQKLQYSQCLLQMHNMYIKSSQQQLKYQNRLIHIEPIQFLDTLKIFKNVAIKKRDKLNNIVFRMSQGVKTIKNGQAQIKIMEQELNILKPQLEESTIYIEKLLQQILQDQQINEQKQTQVEIEEKQAQKQEQHAKELQEQAQAGVELSAKQLKDTLQNLSKLKKEHIIEIKSLNNPALGVKTTLAGLVILLEDNIKQKGGEVYSDNKDINFFEIAKKYLLNDSRELLEILQKFDYSKVSTFQLENLEYYILKKKEFCLQAVERTSYATKFLYLWVKCIVDYTKKYIATEPIRQELIKTNYDLKMSIEQLKLKKKELFEIKQNLEKLRKEMNEKQKQKSELLKRTEDVTNKISIARMLTEGLYKEGIRWEKEVDSFNEKQKYITGNGLLVAIQMINNGPFQITYRNFLYNYGIEQCKQYDILINEESKIELYLSSQNEIYDMFCQGLPKDDNSVQNAIIIQECDYKWPLLIDPQEQGVKYLTKKSQNRLENLMENDKNILRHLELCISIGKWAIIKTNQQGFDDSSPISSLLEKQVDLSNHNNQKFIKVGEKSIQMHENFQLFFITSRDNPTYTPEIFVKLQVLNFAISQEALEEQILAIIFSIENPRLEQRKISLRENISQDQFKLQEIENNILLTLTQTKDMISILEDQKLVNQLQNSTQMSEQIIQKMKDTLNTEKEIDETRETYRKLAQRGTLLYLSILDLSKIDIMYKYSLQWYQNLFENGFDQLKPNFKSFEEKIDFFIKFQTEIIYQNVIQSIFSKHRILYTFLLTLRLQEQNNLQYQKIVQNQQYSQEIQFLVNNNIENSSDYKNLFPQIIPNTWWEYIQGQLEVLEEIQIYKNIKQDCFKERKDLFLNFFLSEKPYYNDQFYESILGKQYYPLQKLVLIKAFRIDKLHQSLEDFVIEYIGQDFIKNINQVNVDQIINYKQSEDDLTPIIFLIQNGVDPREQFLRYAEDYNMLKKYIIVSLGQGQGAHAEKQIKIAKQRGYWILLQNCQFASSWMPELDRIFNQPIADQKIQIQKGYKLWLTTNKFPNFPLSLLQNSIKLAIEPSLSLKTNLQRIYDNMSDIELNVCNKVDEYKKIIFGLSLFHSIIQERNKYGTMGWNIKYDFNDQDFTISQKQILNLLELQEQQDQLFQDVVDKNSNYQNFGDKFFNSLKYLVGNIQYAGKVTDNNDNKLIIQLLNNYINTKSLEIGYQFNTEIEQYFQPDAINVREYRNFINLLPEQTDSRVLGLHQNSNIMIGKEQSIEMLECIKITQNTNFSNFYVKSKEEQNTNNSNLQSDLNLSTSQDMTKENEKQQEPMISFIIHFIKQKIPEKFNIDNIKQKYQITYEQSYNSVLYQESLRYNILINIIVKTINELELAIKGLRQLDQSLEIMSENLIHQKIPQIWQNYGFQSLKPLAGWLKELNDRTQYLQNWIQNGEPIVFWLGAFFQPKIIIIAINLNFSRKNHVLMQLIRTESIVLNKQLEKINKPPQSGCYIHGIYLEGGKWDNDNVQIQDQNTLELYSLLPPIHIKPITHHIQKPLIYDCPVYQTTNRNGILNSSGVNSNYVMDINLQCSQEQDQQFWLFRGLAGFLTLKN